MSETSQNKAKVQKGGCLSMLLGRLGASLVGNILTSTGVIETSQKQGVIRDGDGVITKRQGRGFIRAGYGSTIKKKGF